MPTKVYYDGACHLCSREIDHYAKRDQQQQFLFIDISSPHFSAVGEGLDPVKVDQEMHVKTEDGKIFTGVDAFIELWRQMPGYAVMGRVASLPVVNSILKVGYFCFARIRPLLPKRKDHQCVDGTCYRKRG